ncbi:MAG: hypothetical protein MR471_00015 [Clostridia bacterium]|nr:hypothetical protein [Clostridia bacterium]MDY3785450.1 glycerophosphodiester phosphodiesterase family protein [Eubacteriales bacterium]
MKNKLLRIICIASVLILIIVLTVLNATAESGTVRYSCPAITADAGQKILLGNYAVEFSNGISTSASDITWTSKDLNIGSDGSITAAAPGVFELTATAGTKVRTVYLVVKNVGDTEYVLYYNDFSGTDISDFTVIQKSTGATVAVENGQLVLDASSSSSNYIRILLPSWLSVFGNCKITADITMAKAASSSNWISLMARVQNNNSPYWHACLRQSATASNGMEIAERTSANKWNVTHTAAYKERISASKKYTFGFELQDNMAVTTINGSPMLYSSTVNQKSGRMGIQTRGIKLLVDSIKITVPTESIVPPEANVHTTREQSSNLALTPAMISRITSAEQLDGLSKSSPTVAMMNVDSSLKVISGYGNEICTLAQALEKTGKGIIPAFYLKDSDVITPLCNELKSMEINDVIFVSADNKLLKSARTAYPASQGVLDCTEASLKTEKELYALREKANSSYARVIMLSDSAATRNNVEYLQKLFMTVWSTSADNTVGYIKAITSGANGIIIADREAYEAVLTKYFDKNTLTRLVNVIAHRGSPTLSQENTIASSIIAYNKGATMIENDIYLTRDNVIVVMHDSTIDRTTNGTGKVEGFTYEQLKQFSVNVNQSAPPEPIPTLEDYFKEFKGKDVQLVIEIKKDASTALVVALAKLIKQYDIADQVNVITFSESFIFEMRRLLPGISVGYLTSSITPSESAADESLEAILNKVESMGTTYNPSYASGGLGQKLLRRVSERGITIWPWTVNSMSEFDKYLLLGTNGITTNYSQWVTNYTRRIDAPASEIDITADSVEFKISRLTYGRVRTDITNAQMVIIEDNGAGISYSDGKLYSSGNGTATVFFRLACRTGSGSTYYLCTEPVSVKTSESTDTSTTETEPVETPPVDTIPDETAPVTTFPAETSSGSITEEPEKSGCASAIEPAIFVLMMMPAALIIIRKKRKHSDI